MAKATKKNNTVSKISPDEILVTKEGLKKLKDELEFLKTDKRKQVAERLKEAISYGDLSENSEYSESKEEQAFVEGRIIELGKKIKKAKVVSATSGDSINIGSNVEIENIETKKKEKYKIVGATEAEPFGGKVSNESPIGQALIGSGKGDEVIVFAPKGEIKYKILKIS